MCAGAGARGYRNPRFCARWRLLGKPLNAREQSIRAGYTPHQLPLSLQPKNDPDIGFS